MRKILVFLFSILGILIVVLIIFNHRYPFFTPKIGNWSVGFQHTANVFPKAKIGEGGILTYEYIDGLLPGNINYIADPFFIRENDTFYLFVELKGEGNADVALLTSSNGLEYTYKGIVLDEEFHLSYPQVFKHDGEFYMLPETVGSNHVLLYKTENFPYNWIVIDTLLRDIRLKDPTILLSKELNLIVGVDDNLKQYIFTADSLLGKWLEAKNYKQRWGNETRPGGRLFKVDGEWYLPIQNASLGYGTGISIYKLEVEIEKMEFKLSKKMYLGPQQEIEWFNRGMHHVDIQKLEHGFYMVYDGDRNLNADLDFQYKRTIKWNLIDIYNYIKN